LPKTRQKSPQALIGTRFRPLESFGIRKVVLFEAKSRKKFDA
jgi:hypothetical protein